MCLLYYLLYYTLFHYIYQTALVSYLQVQILYKRKATKPSIVTKYFLLYFNVTLLRLAHRISSSYSANTEIQFPAVIALLLSDCLKMQDMANWQMCCHQGSFDATKFLQSTAEMDIQYKLFHLHSNMASTEFQKFPPCVKSKAHKFQDILYIKISLKSSNCLSSPSL